MPEQKITEAKVDPTVQPSAGISAEATPAAFGAPIGEGLASLGAVADRFHREAWQEANRTAVLDADNQTNGFLNQRLYDPKSGILQQSLGKDAPGAVDKTLADYDQHVAQVTSGLTNDHQRVAYQRMAVARRFEMERALGSYEHGEVTRYADEVDKAAIANATTSAVQNADNPDAVQESIDRQKAVISDAGRRKRLPAEMVQAQQAEAASATHLGVLEQLTSTGQDEAAKAWYDAHKGDLTGKDPVTAAKLVEAGSLAGQAQRTTDAIVVDQSGEVRSRADIDADVRKIADPKLRDEVQTRVDRRLAQHREEIQEQQKASLDQALTVAQASPLGIYDPKVVALKATMDPEIRNRFDAAAAKEFRITSDPVEVNNLLVQSARDPSGFLESMKDPALATRFAKADLESLLAKQAEIKKAGSVADAPSIEAKARVIDDAILAGGYGITGKSGLVTINRNAPGAVALVNEIDTRVKAAEQASGKKATPDDIRKIADEVTIDTVVQPKGKLYGYGAPTQVYKLTPEQRDTATRDLGVYEKANPAAAAQIRANVATMAGKLGLTPDRLTGDQYNRAFAQLLIRRDLLAAGDRVGAQRATDQLDAILREAAKAPSSGHQQARDAMMNRSPWQVGSP